MNKDEMIRWCVVNDPDDTLVRVLLAEAKHQDLSPEDAYDYVVAAVGELATMPRKEALEWATARLKMHNEWEKLYVEPSNDKV